jgi:signal transduction histidine kinase
VEECGDMNLQEVLETKRDEVMTHWQALVADTLAAGGMNASELIDHLPKFLLEIAAALREATGRPATGPSLEASSTAAVHGGQRLRLGFSLDAVVREYGALRQAILATARGAGVQLTWPELDIVADATIIGIAHAVTEYTRQRDAELLRQANEHYAFVAHELRNPLSSATMALHLLKRKGLLPDEDGAVRALERGLKSTTELVEQTLQSARAASGIELRREWTTLKALIEEAEAGATPEAESKGTELRVTIAHDERIEVDRRLVASAVGNLLRNGVKYSRAGGTVEVRGRVAGGWITIEVEDSCGGLAPGMVESAFAPFVRLEQREGADRESGFGLGLAIAKQAVDAHGGNIRVQNLPDKGCIFVLELPVLR